MRLIDADALMETIGITKECKDCARNGVRGCSESAAFVWACESITEAPTIDAVPVVRCRDCKRFKHYELFRGYTLDLCEEYGGQPRCVELDDYCSHGEKR